VLLSKVSINPGALVVREGLLLKLVARAWSQCRIVLAVRTSFVQDRACHKSLQLLGPPILRRSGSLLSSPTNGGTLMEPSGLYMP